MDARASRQSPESQLISVVVRTGALSVVFFAAVSTNAATLQYHLTDIGFPTGDTFSRANAINANGQVVGGTFGPDQQRAFLWTKSGGMTFLGELSGGLVSSEATGINSWGQVTGSSDTSDGPRLFFWTSITGMVNRGKLPGGRNSSSGSGINDSGWMVGSSGTTDAGATNSHAFLWRSNFDPMLDLGDFPGGASNSRANAINNLGQVVGSSTTATGGHAFLWQLYGEMQDLGFLPGLGESASARAINNNGQVVGVSGISAGIGNVQTSFIHAFRWTSATGMQDLGLLPGYTNSSASGINDLGQIVGYVTDPNHSAAVLWSGGQIFNLNSLVDSSGVGWTLTSASAININGWIVGSGTGPDGTTRAYLLTPIPEPSTLALATVGLAGVALLCLRPRQRLPA